MVAHDFKRMCFRYACRASWAFILPRSSRLALRIGRYAHRSLDRIVPEGLRSSPISLFSGLAFPISANPVQIWTQGKGSGNIV